MRYRLKDGFGMKDIQTKENLIHITEKEFIELPDEVAKLYHEWLEAEIHIETIKLVRRVDVPGHKAVPKKKSTPVKKAVSKPKKR